MNGKKSLAKIRKRVTKTHEFIYKSYHEAGHAIYAFLHLVRVSSVSVFENKKFERVHGNTDYHLPNYYIPSNLDEIHDLDLRNELIYIEIGISYAGLIAEKSLFRSISGSKRTPTFISDGSWFDNKSAREMIKKYNLVPSGSKRTAFKQKVMRKVQHELHIHWDAVVVVSHALFKHHRLTFEDLRELLIKKSRNRKFWKEQFKKISYIYDNNQALDENDLKYMLSR